MCKNVIQIPQISAVNLSHLELIRNKKLSRLKDVKRKAAAKSKISNMIKISVVI